jgi:hypothetical protein
MNILSRTRFLVLATLATAWWCLGADIDLENAALKRSLSTENGILRTTRIVNKLAKTEAVPVSCPEFRLRLSQGTDKVGTDIELTAADFRCLDCGPEPLPGGKPGKGLVAHLENPANQLKVEVHYELRDDDFYLRKRLVITSAKPVTLERIDVEVVGMADAVQPYTLKCIYARGKWSPGLGQPLYTSKSGTFWGIEFPAADNAVDKQTLTCGYLWGRQLEAGKAYSSYPAVVGVADDPAFNQDAFFDYINRIRVRPLRLQIQYNSWFDFGPGVNKGSFKGSVETIHRQLVTERGCRPLKAYVIDDGWQDCGKTTDWTDKTWKVNGKFDPDFASSLAATKQAGSTLGLWLSPGCNFGARPMVPKYRDNGFEALENYMSLAGPKYMGLLENRMVELTRTGVTYFKLDGCFGHLNTRDFELHGDAYGLPTMPQLGLEGFTASDKRLNDSKYDELKTYYLVAGTERLMQVFGKMAEANPEVYIVISNGAYLSPWWLMSVDSVWMIMAGDAASGADRTSELTYRDGVYYEIWKQENTQYPMCSIFNHEPKKTATGESKEVFRHYLYMNLSRGTGFIELYLKTQKLQAQDWDVLAEGLQWAYHVFPTFARSRLYGGNPRQKEVYGYTAWNEKQGYVSIHNPAEAKRTYSFTLDRRFGLMPGSGPFHLSSPLAASRQGLKDSYSFGDTITLELQPREIRILNFDKQPVDWSKLRDLQTRTPEPPKPEPAAVPKAK